MQSGKVVCVDKGESDSTMPHTFKVFVNGSECLVTHFHIWNAASNGKDYHTCLCIKEARCSHHTGKEWTLNANQKEKMMEQGTTSFCALSAKI